jgi:hypothetical protein
MLIRLDGVSPHPVPGGLGLQRDKGEGKPGNRLNEKAIEADCIWTRIS